MIQIYPFHKSHYPLLEQWWKAHGWEGVPLHKLPPFGFMAWWREEGESDVPLCGSFAYMDNGGTGVAMMEWTVGDPKGHPKKMIMAMKTLFGFMTAELNKLDYDFILTTCRQKGLARIFEKCGFQQADDGMIHLVNINEG